MPNSIINSLIKTPCGRAKYQELASKQSFLSKIRLVWFILIAAIRDLPLKETN
tara:strand:- start:170 stop:328 length:159 start_codon:yes stop_codon:yes gene_type:complete